LCVKHFTNQMSAVSRLISSDVGRPITDIVSDLIYPELTEDIMEVLRTLITVEKQVKTYNGCWFNTRILPYRTLKGEIDGVVITYINITASKVLEVELLKTKLTLEQQLLHPEDGLLHEVEQAQREVAASKDTKNT
jgi:two-component system CheB/CheR fusion protein